MPTIEKQYLTRVVDAVQKQQHKPTTTIMLQKLKEKCIL
jgi:hypothetical protein